MRLYLDENLPHILAAPLSTVYLDHEFSTCKDEGLGGTEDIPLLATLRERGFDAIITRDRRQLIDPAERRAVVESGLRWVGVSDKPLKGLEQITITVSTLIAGLRFVLVHEPDGPTSYQLRHVQPGQSERLRISPIRA